MNVEQHIVITGAASGLGLQTALRFATEGARLTMVDFASDRLADAAERVRTQGASRVDVIVADLRDPERPAEVIDEAWTNAPIDVLVNSAGIYPSALLIDVTAESWDAVQNINVRAPLLLTTALARRVRDQGRTAAVVNIASTVTMRTRPGAGAYTVSKSAVETLTRSAALELGQSGLRVNAVSPGFVAVDSAVNPVTEEYSAAVSTNPLGRPGTPADVAEAIFWLAGPHASWVTGSVLRVDGGSSAGSPSMPLSWPTDTALDEPA
jgi:3-oxoacyl-[acyl-carrier protein] reductase